jgi:ribonuclease HI
MKSSLIHIFTDASVKPNMTGIGMAIKDANGRLIAWRGKRDHAMTCNEAEYAALIFALEQALAYAAGEVWVYSDSKVVIEQMQGVINVNSDTLRPLYRTAHRLAQRFPCIRFTHIPREQNELADAMAEDACHIWEDQGVRGR